jgi:hypothetical protein
VSLNRLACLGGPAHPGSKTADMALRVRGKENGFCKRYEKLSEQHQSGDVDRSPGQPGSPLSLHRPETLLEAALLVFDVRLCLYGKGSAASGSGILGKL